MMISTCKTHSRIDQKKFEWRSSDFFNLEWVPALMTPSKHWFPKFHLIIYVKCPENQQQWVFLSQNQEIWVNGRVRLTRARTWKKISITDMESEVFQTTDTDMRFTKIADADANRVSAKLWSTETFQMVGSQLIFKHQKISIKEFQGTYYFLQS